MAKYGFVFIAHIIDTTCEECEELDGTQWDADDPDMPQLPIHPNCNCRLEPIMLGDDYNEDDE
jgi:hypothetical protein